MAAGAGSGLVASLIRVPTEVIKQRMQSGAVFSLPKAAPSRPALPAALPCKQSKAVLCSALVRLIEAAGISAVFKLAGQ